jgi:methylmalonyl-CoA/ethylmalonyl-CoA epimerase
VTAFGLGAVLDHTALAAPRIRDLLPLYRELLGGEFYDGGDNTRAGYRAIQLRYPDGSKTELMEPLAGSTFFDSFFRRNPQGGVHHLTFVVPSMPEALAAARAAGYSLVGEHTADEYWQEAFLHPREANGTLVQLARPGPSYAPAPGLTLDDVLAGRGLPVGSGVPSP